MNKIHEVKYCFKKRMKNLLWQKHQSFVYKASNATVTHSFFHAKLKQEKFGGNGTRVWMLDGYMQLEFTTLTSRWSTFSRSHLFHFIHCAASTVTVEYIDGELYKCRNFCCVFSTLCGHLKCRNHYSVVSISNVLVKCRDYSLVFYCMSLTWKTHVWF